MSQEKPDMDHCVGLLTKAVSVLDTHARESVRAAGEVVEEARQALNIKHWRSIHVLPTSPSASGGALTQIKEG